MTKIKAPLDEKNVTTDWIEQIFDGLNCVQNGCQMVGFVNECVVDCSWFDNTLQWRAHDNKKETLNEIKKRLMEFEQDDSYSPEVYSDIYIVGGMFLVQKFYFND